MPFVTQADDRFLSPFNADREMLASMHLPQQVILNDLTFREERQVEGLSVTPQPTRRVARELEDAGIPMLQLHNTRTRRSHPWIFRAISPELVGNQRRVALAGVSRATVVQAKATELGMDLTAAQCEEALPRIRAALASRPGGISDDEFRRLASVD